MIFQKIILHFFLSLLIIASGKNYEVQAQLQERDRVINSSEVRKKRSRTKSQITDTTLQEKRDTLLKQRILKKKLQNRTPKQTTIKKERTLPAKTAQRTRRSQQVSTASQASYPLFYQLVNNMKLYKTINTGFHAGHLYEHCMWTAQVVDEWFENYKKNNSREDAQWVRGISEQYRRKIVLAAFLHDIGKAANSSVDYNVGNEGYFDTSGPVLNAYPYFNVIVSHPQDGFEMVMPEADGDANSPEDFFMDTPISYYNVKKAIDKGSLIRIGLNAITTLTPEKKVLLEERIFTFMRNYDGTAIDFDTLFDGIAFLEHEESQLRSLVRRIVDEPVGTIYKENLMKGPRIKLEDVFEELGFSDQDRRFIAILIGIHWSFGVPVVSDYDPENNQGKTEAAYETFLKRLSELAVKAEYNNGLVDDILLRAAILIGAADVKGSSVTENYENFINRYEWFSRNKTLFEKPSAHGEFTCVPMFDKFKFPTKGLAARNGLLDYFAENYPNGYKISDQALQKIEDDKKAFAQRNSKLDKISSEKIRSVQRTKTPRILPAKRDRKDQFYAAKARDNQLKKYEKNKQREELGRPQVRAIKRRIEVKNMR